MLEPHILYGIHDHLFLYCNIHHDKNPVNGDFEQGIKTSPNTLIDFVISIILTNI